MINLLSDNEELTGKIIGAAIEVHKYLGPGLLESMYEQCLIYELKQLNLQVESQYPLPIKYKGSLIGGEYRVDLIVEKQVIVEVKSVKEFAPVHENQLLTYLKLYGGGKGLLINFNVNYLVNGIKRLKL